jgi:hypothetical protein
MSTASFVMGYTLGLKLEGVLITAGLGTLVVLLLWWGAKIMPAVPGLGHVWKLAMLGVGGTLALIAYNDSIVRVEVRNGSLTYVASVILRYSMPLADMKSRRVELSRVKNGTNYELILEKDGRMIAIPNYFPSEGFFQLDCILSPHAPWDNAAVAVGHGFARATTCP